MTLMTFLERLLLPSVMNAFDVVEVDGENLRRVVKLLTNKGPSVVPLLVTPPPLPPLTMTWLLVVVDGGEDTAESRSCESPLVKNSVDDEDMSLFEISVAAAAVVLVVVVVWVDVVVARISSWLVVVEVVAMSDAGSNDEAVKESLSSTLAAVDGA